jgi:Fe-S cluster assembly protein SufB
MAYTEKELKKELDNKSYEFGFVTDIESEKAPKGLNVDIIKLISSKKNEPQWLLDYRLKAFRIWSEMKEPQWAHVNYKKPDFQDIIYYAAPKQKKLLKSLDEVDPELLKTMEKLGISIEEQKKIIWCCS